VAAGTTCNLAPGAYSFTDVQIAGSLVLLGPGPVTLTVSNVFNVTSSGWVLGNGTGQAVGVPATGCTLGGANTGGVHGGVGGPGTSSSVVGSSCGSHEWYVRQRHWVLQQQGGVYGWEGWLCHFV
jgi:hypothetical protein